MAEEVELKRRGLVVENGNRKSARCQSVFALIPYSTVSRETLKTRTTYAY